VPKKSYKYNDATRGYEQTVDVQPDSYGWNDWIVYPEYRIGEHEGRRFVYAPMPGERFSEGEPPLGEEQFLKRFHYCPLSRRHSSLFLEFARWPEEFSMDIDPADSDKNTEAAREWAEIYGVLGIDPPDLTVWGDSPEVIEAFLGRPGPDSLRDRDNRNEARGGPKETVERFADEAWVANMVLRLYEAASNPEGPDVDIIIGFMPDQRDGWMDSPSVRELYGKTPDTARSWARGVVEEIVGRQVRRRCWTIPIWDGSSHREVWTFDSLLGAMWLQMQWLMYGQPRRCEWCGALLDMDPERAQQLEPAVGDASISGRRKPPSHKRFCNDRHKAKWNYYRGLGTSNRKTRKKTRDRQRRNLDTI
jgi:hypothetical protein